MGRTATSWALAAALVAAAAVPPGALAAGATVTVSPNPVDLGSVPVGSTGPEQTVTIANSGPGPVQFTGGTTIKGTGFVFINGCSGSLAEGASCSVRLRAAPTQTGTFTDRTLTLTSDAAAPGAKIGMTFTGTPASSAPAITEFPIPPVGTTNAVVKGLTVGADANLWLTDVQNNRLVRMTLDGTFSSFALAPGASPQGIIRGGGGSLRYYQQGTCCNGLQGFGTTDVNGVQTAFQAASVAALRDLTLGPDGFVYYTDGAAGIGRVGPTGAIVYRLPAGSTTDLYGITTASDGQLWAANYGPMQLVAMTTGGQMSLFSVAPLAPAGIVAGPDGALWFNARTSNIGRLTTDGGLRVYDVRIGSFLTRGMVFDPTGNLWYASGSFDLVRLTPGGTETDYKTSAPMDFGVLGPDGNLWFVEKSSPPRLARIDLGLSPAATLAPATQDLGSVVVGQTSATRTFTLTNNGPGRLSVTGATVSDTAQFSATIVGGASSCTGLLQGQTCSIQVTASPQNTGTQTTTLTVTSNATNGPHTAQLTVTGAAPPVRSITVSPGTMSCAPALYFPNGGCTSTPVTVTNGTAAGHVVVAGAAAVPGGGGPPWTLCGGSGSPVCSGAQSRPGTDEFTTTLTGGTLLGASPAADLAFGAGGTAAAGQSVSEIATTTAPSASTSPSTTFSTTVTWTAVP